jgi:hypothetical protein
MAPRVLVKNPRRAAIVFSQIGRAPATGDPVS